MMLTLSPKTLSSSSSSLTLHKSQNPRCKSPNSARFKSSKRRSHPVLVKSEVQIVRDLEFEPGETFFRHESATGRDLGVLSATLHKRSNGTLRVLDAMCGCGIRSLRYLVEADADFVMANDANDDNRKVITDNLSRVERGTRDERRWVVTHLLANKAMIERYMVADFFDMIDIDSFGNDSSFLRDAFNTLRLGGLLYLTSTDGYSSGGHRPYNSLAAYGAFIRPMPFGNEIGLRMLIGGAVREAALLGYHVTPLFSYYSYHGPVFRVMLRVHRGKLHEDRNYGFVTHCNLCGHSHTLRFDELGLMGCHCSDTKASSSLVVSGPMWLGPLHDASYVTEMLELAKELGWVGEGTGMDLEKLLSIMIEESDPRLPPGYTKMDEMASRAKMNSPPLKKMMSALVKEGYAVSRSHIIPNALKTDCPMSIFVKIAQDNLKS
ncbi:PREDICTED: LOW QUALITY PROTEIN: tRNA (guanine(26)-N(2))-dimethyltransferase-like [Camelina sativa]|uniref:tRNA (guanine(26)-N(2))-dimethyltransferase n=1 Tax=Camelina sativa TaxID=90675 RepID=A0ABM0YQS9_CAMSA|nr:PREDICTED: LOW QUALITY PROTEIN: tRNA (guanine(26)-N(2))-dimethyltransferase-like [Camelina sativa]